DNFGTAVRRHWHSVSAVVVLVGLVGAVTVGSLGHRGTSSSHFSMNSGGAWFADRQAGFASELDGPSSTRLASTRVSSPGDRVVVSESGDQSGAGAYVADQSTGTVSRIDGAALQLSPVTPARFSAGSDPDLAVLSNAKATWVIDHNGADAVQVAP